VSTSRPPRAYWHVHARIRLGDQTFLDGDCLPQGRPELEPSIRRYVAAGFLTAANEPARQLAELWGGSVATKLV
jgi:hypothetical protein